jgi:iron(III) transport system ATP-binding protein
MSKQASIQIKNLVKEFQTHDGKGIFRAVDDVSVDIASGQFVTLLGPSGCGKTTILRMIAGFETATSGDIILDGQRINDITPDKRDSSMVFQSYALFPHYNVFENVAYGLVNKKLSKDAIKEKVMQMLELVGLKGLEERSTNQLSGGQQQRVALARALVMEPAVLLFDEPLSNLDAKLRVYMRKEIRKIQQRIGLTSIYVTHDQSEAMSLSDKIIIMNKGHIEQVGSPAEIYQRPVSRFVADFIGNANFVDGVVKEVEPDGVTATVTMLGSDFVVHGQPGELTAGDLVDVVVRPEAVTLLDQGRVTAEVTGSTYMGAVQDYVLKIGAHELNVEAFNPVGKKIYQMGDVVGLQLDRNSLHAIKKAKEAEDK